MQGAEPVVGLLHGGKSTLFSMPAAPLPAGDKAIVRFCRYGSSGIRPFCLLLTVYNTTCVFGQKIFFSYRKCCGIMIALLLLMRMNYMQTFAQQLNAVRRARGMTQEQLAQEMNVSRQTISHWENGRAQPDVDMLKQLYHVLNYNFLTEEDVTISTVAENDAEVAGEAPVPAEGTAPDQPAQPVRHRWVAAVIAAVLLLWAVIAVQTGQSVQEASGIPAMPTELPAAQTEPAEPYSLAWYQQEQEPVAGQAFVRIEPMENPVPVRANKDMEGGWGWFYTFRIGAAGDAAFTIDQAVINVFNPEGRADHQVFTGDIIESVFDSYTLVPDYVGYWSGGFPEQNVSGIGFTLNGKDAGGNELSFHGYLELSHDREE